MKKMLIAAFLLFVSSTTADAAAKPAKPSETWYTVRVDNGHGSGTGTVIAAEKGHSFILTNAHVCEQASNTINVEHEGHSYHATYVYGSSVDHPGPGMIKVNGPDLCIIRIDVELDTVIVATASPSVGDKVFQRGFGGGVHTADTRTGEVSRGRFLSDDMITTAVPIPGDSGSGIFNEAGELIGVCWGTGGDYGIAVDLKLVHSFVLDSRFEGHMVQLQIGLTVRKSNVRSKAAPLFPGIGSPNCPNGRCPKR